ncbi:hypothetical protein [Marinibactrum halimedae]|uniref:Uncharacterized protein n=1 Tax=Marinibactrum halimedae TaxID=1444977 RepID=A0AA37TBT1_9GAMM|nr:hypothetical protein [Marinibactrum halimedae]MCD9458476.1 hypothetical protein [Marinibactrum halimedae]GLS26172.1 hypothetical protein GCM10007877_18870 [Marinibactrum halimedae]
MRDFVFVILFLFSFLVFLSIFAGLFKPSLIRQKTRAEAFGKSSVIFFLSIVALVVAAPKDSSDDKTINLEEKEKIYISVDHKIDDKGYLYFEIASNLSQENELFLFLENSDGDNLGGSSGFITNGRWVTEKFSHNGKSHLVGKYYLSISEKGKGNLYKGERLFQPFRYEFDIQSNGVSPPAMTKSQKLSTLDAFDEIINTIKAKRYQIEEVRRRQPTGRGQSGSIFTAKWNGEVQRWRDDSSNKYGDILGSGISAPFCPSGAFHTRTSMTALVLLGVGYVSGKVDVKKKNLERSLSKAEQEIQLCRDSV